MSNIMDIARSSIAAYRTALGITGENIANVNTEGYRRRDVTTSQIGGAQTTVTTLATGGQGVQVNQIRRAFDQLLADRLRTATGDMSASTVSVDAAKAVEAQLLPNSGGIDAALEDFFAAMGSLASSPADTALRRVAIESGNTLASAFQNVAGGLMRLRDDTMAEAGMAAASLTDDLNALNELQQRFTSNTGSVGALNPLHDERDRLLASIADKVGISVELDKIGRARITLGTGGGGPELLGLNGPAIVTASADPDLALQIKLNGTVRETRLIGSGALGGYRAALGGIDDALAEVDSLARKMAGEMNAVHRVGLDMTGAPGGDMFSLDGWTVTRAAGNQGFARATVTPDGPDLTGPITLTRDAAAGVWNATDSAGNLLASADKLLVLPNLTITVEGDPANGDRFTIDPTSGKAANMRFLPQIPARLAAAVASLVAPAPGNTGSGSVAMAPTTVAAPALPLLPDLLATAPDAASAITLRNAGVVGYIPAGSTDFTLASLGQQATADLTAAASPAALSVTAGGVTTAFDLTTLADGSARPAGWTLADIATALNDGRLAGPAGETLASLGISAAATGNTLSLSLNAGTFAAASLDGVAATLSPPAPQGGTLQIFTREGRQIAGTPMSAAEVALLFTPQNGFLPGAQYVTDYLNAAAGTGYRGLTLDATQGSGLQGLALSPSAITGWTGLTPAPAAAPQAIAIDTGLGLPVSLTLPEGGTAKRLASMIADAIPGMQATAQTSVALTASADGRVSFKLAGLNIQPFTVTGDVAGGRLDALALSVNALTGSTGIAAQLSPDGTRLMLTQDSGEDIRITALTHAAGGTVTLQRADVQGVALGSPTILGAGVENARVTGQVLLHREQGFSVTMRGQRNDSAADATAGGLIASTTSAAGAVTALTFALDPAFDAASPALAGPTRYSLTLGGRSVTLDTATSGASSPEQVASGLAALLRDGMPQAALTGGAVTQLPSDGATTVVRLDGQDYVLRMQNGAVSVSGPEQGRLSATFGPDMRLRLAVNGGSTDGGMISLPAGANGAPFGLSPAQGPTGTLKGQPATGPFPATLDVEIAGTRHSLTVTAGPNVTLPAGFPGFAAPDATGAITLTIPAGAGAVRILPGADAAGFSSLGASTTVAGATLTATASDGTPLGLTTATSALAGQRLHLSNLPPEDLIVVMTGSGALRMAGSVTTGPAPTTVPDVELRVLDATTRQVELVDLRTGHSIGTRTLDASGGTVVGGLSVSVSGNPATGDAFRLTANRDGRNDGRALDAILALRFPDVASGKGGFARILSDLQSEVGTRASAAETKLQSDTAIHDTVRRADAAQGAVDLDREAARLLELQQAYQASAQIMTVAKDLFDTLLRSL
ncbi:FlgK family flagellar hook-associated protein [Paragemmobacter straminiformis]|uniref:Flagellar hook-associated protein 1 n=1 Tax=Paragemmobacter straminiformis TaxID=2045119 RepID=A0A842I710_9RHOB|nr:flagellar basal body rod C-terminal domain-containing protein [Gemmobacter straminiformis]MBC2834758.1 flagellar hook-associated protein FlgK [Gemmobacter straminiformis]